MQRHQSTAGIHERADGGRRLVAQTGGIGEDENLVLLQRLGIFEVGLDVALEALRDARRLKKLNVNEVWRIAERRRALTFMRPYLESLG